MRRALVVLAVAVLALGQGVVAGTVATTTPGGTTFLNEARTYTTDEVLNLARLADGTVTTQTFRKAVTWGSRVAYYGNLVMVGALVSDGLFWFYNELQRETGTSLDNYADGSLAGVASCDVSDVAGLGSGWACGDVNSNYYFRITGYSSYSWNNVVHYQVGVTQRCGSTVVGGSVEYSPSDSFTSRFNAWRQCVPQAVQDAWTGGVPSLSDTLASDPAAMSALQNQVLPQFIDHAKGDGTQYPYTYAQPLPGTTDVTLDPAPSNNQWADDPYAFPATDTDGDGWPDWMEYRLGSNPTNAASYPDSAADQDGDGFTNGEELAVGTDPADPMSRPGTQTVDSDSDGIADSADPCPTDPTNECGIQKQLDGVAQEATQQSVLGELRGQTSLLNGIDSKLTDNSVAQLSSPDVALDPVTQPSLSYQAWDSVQTQVSDAYTSWWETAKGKVPFGFGGGWFPTPPTLTGAGGCEPVGMAILGVEQSVGLCNTPIDTFLHTVFRAAVLGVMMLGAYFGMARAVSVA